MINPKRLVRGVFLALAMVVAAPLAGTGGFLLGVDQALAQNRDPLIAAVLFEGNQGFSDAELIAMVDVATRGEANPGLIAADAESIRQAYEGKGYTNVTVTTRTEQADEGRVRVVFEINEGNRSGIAAINFTGNNSIDAGTLKSVIKTHETSILSWLLRDDTYDPAKVAIDKELIRIYYGNRGFPDAVVTSVVAEYDASRNAYFLNFTISEGDRYTFGGISIETSIAGLDANALQGAVRTREGERYSLADLERTQSDMAQEATSQGYSFADVRPRINRDTTNHIFSVTYLVDEGPRVYVERVDITGNEKTRDFVIRRELPFAEGDPFNRSMVTRGKAAIEALGFFKSVAIDLQPGSAADKVDIHISVVEDSTGDYGATVGYASDQGILGEVSLTERNFLGRGQYLRVALGASASGRSFDFSFTEPRFMGLKISSGVDAYHRIVDENSSNYYGSTATGGQLRLGVPITRDVSSTVFAGVETKNFVDVSGLASTVAGPLNGVTRNKFWVGYSLVYDGLDDIKAPTEGLYATLSMQYLGWDYNLLKTEAKARYFFPLMPDTGIVASVKGQAGAITAISGGVSPLEGFFPSSSLIRGFDMTSFGPKIMTGESTGTTAYAGISGEIEFPIPVLPDTYGIRGAVWADAAWIGAPTSFAGVLDANSTNQPLKSSVGASVIWNSPFGPIRGDFGYVISKANTDKTQIFQLTIQNLL